MATGSTSRAIAAMLHSFLSGAATGATFAPVPLLPVAFQLIDQIITCCENVCVNREAVKAMQEQCRQLYHIMSKIDCSREDENMRMSIMQLLNVLRRVYNNVDIWTGYGRVRSFFLQSQVMTELGQCATDIEKHIKYFELASHNDIRTKVHRIEKVVVDTATDNQSEMERLHWDMVMMQEQLAGIQSNAEKHRLAARALYNIQVISNMLLPDVELKAGEIRRTGTRPVGGSTIIDIWDGVYLEYIKCTLKNIRTMNFTERQRERLVREVKIWHKLWELDRGKYIVPLFGVCYIEGPYPYLVSPYYHNGDAVKYIRNNPEINRLALIRRVAEGLEILHNQDPPIAHGELMAAKIMIDDVGNPLISDFGLAKLIESTTGVPFTQTTIGEQNYRWFAPELCSNRGVVSTASDVFAFGRTILEIMTGSVPFSDSKRIPDVILRVQNGVNPPRPIGQDIGDRGLDDSLWNLLLRCWSFEAGYRPTMKEIVSALPGAPG